MIHVAKALVYATSYINIRTDDMDSQHDVDALESISSYLILCSSEEKEVLKRAIGEMMNEETHKDLLKTYKHWYENMFVE